MLQVIEHSTEKGRTWTLRDGEAVFKHSGDIDLILSTYNELYKIMKNRAAQAFGIDIEWIERIPHAENPTAPELVM